MAEIVIRKAVLSDCTRMMELIRELAEYEKAPQEVTVSFDHFTASGFGPNPVWWAFVAEVDGKVEGFALYYIRYSTWKGQRMYLEDLIVTEQQRRLGLGKQLFKALVDEAAEQGFSGIVWQVLDWNEPAIKFYQQLPGIVFDGEWINCSMPISTNK